MELKFSPPCISEECCGRGAGCFGGGADGLWQWGSGCKCKWVE